jgi:hypothetical protein
VKCLLTGLNNSNTILKPHINMLLRDVETEEDYETTGMLQCQHYRII